MQETLPKDSPIWAEYDKLKTETEAVYNKEEPKMACRLLFHRKSILDQVYNEGRQTLHV